jgi:hypothetical protein
MTDTKSDRIPYKAKEIKLKSSGTVMVVGMSPGRQRHKEKTQVAWEGNQSADIMLSAIAGMENIYLTNAINFYKVGEITKEDIADGIENLKKEIFDQKPVKIIAVGGFARRCLKKVEDEGKMKLPMILEVKHPSFILRFKHDKQHWKKMMRKAIDNG